MTEIRELFPQDEQYSKCLQNYQKWCNYEWLDVRTRTELENIKDDKQKIKEYFNAPLEFGTAGLRGIMRAGINGMNVYVVRHTTQGIANLIKSQRSEERGVVIAYDSRNNSELFAHEAASVLAANGIKVYIFDGVRPTPELSFAIGRLACVAGINITASHNPKQYNGYKAYWSDGAQLPPDHAKTVFTVINNTDIFEGVLHRPYNQLLKDDMIKVIGEEMDKEYLHSTMLQSIYPDIVADASTDFKVVYTPLHGAGHKLVPEVLKQSGLKKLFLVEEQMKLDGNFPTVKLPNPEYKEAFTLGIELAKQHGCSLIVGTDPDADRMGIVVRVGNSETGAQYETLSGNQVGALLLDYIITGLKAQNKLPENACAIKTIVTTELASRIAEYHGVKSMDVLTGFKFIGEKIKQFLETGKHTFIFGFEESYGYLAGTEVRDKDAVAASMLVVEMAAYYKKKRMTLYDALQELYTKYGYYEESVETMEYPGIDGVQKMTNIMAKLRKAPPVLIGESKVEIVRDYLTLSEKYIYTGQKNNLSGTFPSSNVLSYKLMRGSKVIIRPSGTEPKIKIYYLLTATDKYAAELQMNDLKKGMKELLGE